MGRAKALVPLAGRPLLDHVLSAVRRSRARDIVVVLGHDAERIRREVALDGARVVVNLRYAEGMSTSIRAGVRAAGPGSQAFLVVLGDQPLVAPATLDTLIDRWSATGAKILIPTFRGARGNPVLLDRSISSEIEKIAGDQGCRAIFPGHAGEIAEVEVDDPGVLIDVDTEEQVGRVQAALDRGESKEAIAAQLAPSRVHLHGAHAPAADRAALQPTVDVLAIAHDLTARNEPFALATVVRIVKPASGRPGNKAIVRPDKEMLGWIGGSCAESVVLAESLASMRDGRPRLLRLARDVGAAPVPEGVVEYVMECHSGGTMDIYIEPHLPKPRLLIVGDSPVASALAAYGRLLGFRVAVVAPGGDRAAFPEADEFGTELEALGERALPGSYAVVATMGKYDETALRSLAGSRAEYVGLVASRKRAAAVLEELRKAGVPEDAVKRIRSPAGLDLSAETPEEIALSIIAEITKVRRAGPKEIPVAPVEPAPKAEGTAIDPVCGMEVELTSPLRQRHEGTEYLFCSESCRTRFRKNPQKFLA
jgi:xanthine dehydrogenase accessory factor